MMGSSGKRVRGGRRQAPRENLNISAPARTIHHHRVLVLVDLSSTGARMRGPMLPRPGEVISIKVDYVRAFGTVAWSEGDECGVEFDSPIQTFAIARLRRQVSQASVAFGEEEQPVAIDEWKRGLATSDN